MIAACATLADVSDPGPTPPRLTRSDGPSVLSVDDLLAATGGELLRRPARPIRGAAVDSRRVAPGNLFAALPGERTDGHRFLAAAVDAGASALLVARAPDPAAGEPPLEALDAGVVRVPDVLRALQAVAATWRRRFDPLVVGVTGSVAKTSTKEATAAVLAERFRTLRTEGNENNEIGLPLTVLRLGPEDEAAVLEMGMYVGGEIRELAAIGRPRIGVVTAVQAVHLSRIGTLDAIEAAKGELVEALPAARDGGVAVLNADDERVRRMASRTDAAIRTYGFAPDADVRAEDVVSAGFAGMRFLLVAAGGRHSATIPGLGRLAVHNALAAAAVGLAAGLGPDEVLDGLARGWSAPHRGRLVRVGEVTLVDDAYNASPGSVRAALELLGGLPGRRVAVLGEMLELGVDHEAGHRAAGAAAAPVADLLVVVDGQPGGGAAGIAAGARAAGLGPERLLVVPDRAAAADALRRHLRAGDVVLLKASRGIELDRLVDDLGSPAAPAAGEPA